MANAVPLLEISEVSKHFGGVYALQGANLTVDSGEIHALIGPNGAGKTTLIHTISGALRPDQGDLRLAGRAVTGLPMHRRVALGLARSYQITNIFQRLTVLDNVAFAVQARTRDWGSSFRFWRPFSADREIVAEARDVLEQLGLGELAARRAGSLAHGEQRALEVALALATRPRLLLLDEPMAGMGPEESERMVGLIGHLARKVTILLVEHDMDAVFRLADRISVLVAGSVIASGLPEAIRTDPAVRAAYLGDSAEALIPIRAQADTLSTSPCRATAPSSARLRVSS